MNVLILGSGGREHALAWKVGQSPLLGELFIAPGNAGTAQVGTNLDLNPMDFPAVTSAISRFQIELVIVGPEVPLVGGLVDYLSNHLPRVKVIGPESSGARLEGSKAFSKSFMRNRSIPTAGYRDFTMDESEAGHHYISQHSLPIVLKADGLAAGKGVVICTQRDQARHEFDQMLGGKFGDAGTKVVIEEYLDGLEFSVFVLTDGKHYQLLPVAKDYKRIGEGDTGLNTGGMGSVSPVPFIDDQLMQKVEKRIIEPTIRGLNEETMTYKGFIFFGLINVRGEPYVIEYNCRLGDPETQSILPRLKNDLIALCLSTCDGTLADQKIEIDERAVASVVLVSGGYPGTYEKGKEIHGLRKDLSGLVFHAGTKENKGKIVTNGGRVLAVTCYGSGKDQAIQQANMNAELIDFAGKYYRRDIGFDL